MTTKLTLSINEGTIRRAKRYAKNHHTSLSALVEHYFSYLAADQIEENEMIGPLVAELSGLIELDSESEIKEEYGKHLVDKYLK